MSELTGVSQQPICENSSSRTQGTREAGEACKPPPGPTVDVNLELCTLSWGHSTDNPACAEQWAGLPAAAGDSTSEVVTNTAALL